MKRARAGAARPALSKRARLAAILDRAGLLDRLLWLRGRSRPRSLAVLTYHRVGAANVPAGLDRAVADVEPEELERQLAVVKAHCTVVSIADVRLFLRGRKLPPNPVMITFDDGYSDCHDVALPILRRAGVPATFFVPTAFPGAGRLFWWDRVSLLLHRCQAERVELEYPRRLVLAPRADPEGAAAHVARAIKRTPGVELERVWEELERVAGVALAPAEERALAARQILSWDAVRSLDAAGMDVESHSHDHMVLNTLSPDAARRDLERSAAVLRDELGRAPFAVAYPVGYELGGLLRGAPAGAAFELGFTNNTGLCDLGRFDPLNVPRLAMDPSNVGPMYKLSLLAGDGQSSRSLPTF